MRKDGRGHDDPGGYDDDHLPIASTVFAIVAPLALGFIVWWFGS